MEASPTQRQGHMLQEGMPISPRVSRAVQHLCPEIEEGALGMEVLHPPTVLHPHGCCIVSATKRTGPVASPEIPRNAQPANVQVAPNSMGEREKTAQRRGLSHRAPRGLIWRLEAPRSHHRLHEVVSVHAQEADLHAGPNLRQRIEHDPSDMGAGPVEDRDELPRCNLPDLLPVLARLQPEEHLGLLLEAEDR